jgi:hypothetical protein
LLLRLLTGIDDGSLEIGKIFARTQDPVPDMAGKQLLKKVAANGPFIHSQGASSSPSRRQSPKSSRPQGTFIKVLTTAMYSPKIDEELIPRLYRLRKLKRIPMTRLVNGILRSVLPALEEEERKKELACSKIDKANAGTTA